MHKDTIEKKGETKHMIYNSQVERMLSNGWELKAIFFKVNKENRTEEYKLRVYLFKRNNKEYLKKLSSVNPKKDKEIEYNELYSI